MTTAPRARAIAFAAFILLLGLGLLANSVGELATLVRGFGENRPVIVSEHYAVSGIFLGVFSLSFAAVLAFSPPSPTQHPGRRKQPTRAERLAGPYLLFVLVCILAALFAPTVQQLVVASAAHARGYVHCPAITWPRRQPDRWARAGSLQACPREGASPTS
jgi:formate hydrogenlyase subunit 3/multisubunit Na+/H+ antiporter MnhD subunit